MDDVPSTSGLGVVGLTEEAASLLATETVYNADLTIDDAESEPLNETAEEVSSF